MKKLKILVWIILITLVIIILYFSTIIVQAVLSDYQPEEVTALEITGNADKIPAKDSVFTLVTWNIGFSGLGEEMDFFYDGGTKVHPPEELVNKYFAGISNFIKSNDTLVFILLQEVDKNSSRTNFQNQVTSIQQLIPYYPASFGINYKVKFIPIPFFNPLGKVEMGQMNLSKYQPDHATRHSYYSAYSWPKRLFMLDRCFLVSTFELANGKNLVVLNTHNSAYDAGGQLRQQEMPVISNFMLSEYGKGNYVVAGGDWNQNPPEYDLSEMNPGYHPVMREILDDSLFPPEWEIVYDSQQPTNREIDAPYSKETTEVTIIDYFIISPNLKLEEVKTLSQEFKFSDHEPVYLRIKLN